MFSLVCMGKLITNKCFSNPPPPKKKKIVFHQHFLLFHNVFLGFLLRCIKSYNCVVKGEHWMKIEKKKIFNCTCMTFSPLSHWSSCWLPSFSSLRHIQTCPDMTARNPLRIHWKVRRFRFPASMIHPVWTCQWLYQPIMKRNDVSINNLQNNPKSERTTERGLYELLKEKEKTLVTSIFFLSYNVLYPMKKKSDHFKLQWISHLLLNNVNSVWTYVKYCLVKRYKENTPSVVIHVLSKISNKVWRRDTWWALADNHHSHNRVRYFCYMTTQRHIVFIF